MSVASRHWRSGLALPVGFALIALATFIGLGTWQLQRKTWKEALIATLEQRLAASPTTLPARGRWPSLDAHPRHHPRRVRRGVERQQVDHLHGDGDRGGYLDLDPQEMTR